MVVYLARKGTKKIAYMQEKYGCGSFFVKLVPIKSLR
jgi:hypothetical protein